MKRSHTTRYSLITNQSGFTIVELMVSMVIIAIILALSVNVLISARRQQELITVKNSLVDLIREAKNTSLSPTAFTGAKVIGVRLTTGTDCSALQCAELIQYPFCLPPTPCSPFLIKSKSSEFFGGPIRIKQVDLVSESGGGSGSLGTAGYIFYSIPFGKACITTSAPTNVGTSSIEVSSDYPVNSTSTNQRSDRCVDHSDSNPPAPTTKQLSSYIYIILEHSVNPAFTQTIKVNTYSGDVSDA